MRVSTLICTIAASMLLAQSALAADSKLEIRVIHAKKGAAKKSVDNRLRGLASDLKGLPFDSYKLIDAHKKIMSPKERVSLEFPGKNKKRFLVVNSLGSERSGKQRFSLSIRDLKFNTKVAVPDGGTILVGGPRYDGGTIFFAITAQDSVKSRRVKSNKRVTPRQVAPNKRVSPVRKKVNKRRKITR